jgi:hypothetical protein
MLNKGASDMANGGQSHKTFLYKFTNSFCKLDRFMAIQQVLLLFIKWFEKSVSKVMPNMRSTLGWLNMLKQKIPLLKAL